MCGQEMCSAEAFSFKSEGTMFSVAERGTCGALVAVRMGGRKTRAVVGRDIVF